MAKRRHLMLKAADNNGITTINTGREIKEPCDSVGIRVTEYSQIIVFRDEEFFLGVLETNPHLKAIYGTKDYEKRALPGVYIAAY